MDRYPHIQYHADPGGPERGRPVALRARIERQLHDRATRPITIALLATAATLVLALAYWIVLLAELPSTDDLRRSRFERATIVYAADGTELTSYQDRNRRWVALSEISPRVVEAVLAAEDHRFYEHQGIDVFRTIGAFFRTLGGDAQGGSTITMQFARNAFADISDDMVVTRKIKEWITALRIEAMYEKDEILEMYLNTVPFMYNAFGIEAAAQTYFQVPASELNARGAATLVGMLKGTVFYNPVRHPERSHERRNVVLQQMVRRGYLEPDEYERMRDVPTRLDFRRLRRSDGPAPHFTAYLRAWLDEWAEERGYNLYADGLRVYTTIDPRLQAAAEAAVKRVGDELQAVADVEWSRSSPPFFSASASAYRDYRRRVKPFEYFWTTHPDLLTTYIRQTSRYGGLRDGGLDDEAALAQLRGDATFVDSVKSMRQRLQAGFVAPDPRTGHVKAWVGGRDFDEIQYDHVAQARRQPGSTFKPFVYAAALEQGYGPDDPFRDEVVEFVDPDTRRRWRPRNVGAVTGELVTLRDALAYSKNTITTQLVLRLGPERVVAMARRMGIQSELPAYPSIGLGTGEVTLLELAGAYTPIADHGRHHPPVFVTRIDDQQGRTLARFGTETREAISPVTAYNLLDMMRGVVDRGTGRRIRSSFGAQGDLAGKTGTTQNGADGWFMLVHPNLVAGAWVGFDVPAMTFRSRYWGQGAHTALHVVGHFYRAGRQSAPEVLAAAKFQPPPGYRPPRPAIDTTHYASYYDSSYIDSLNAVADSILNASYDYWSAYDEDDLGMYEPDSAAAASMPEADSLDLGELELGGRADDEPLSETDSLNRSQRIRRGTGGGRSEGDRTRGDSSSRTRDEAPDAPAPARSDTAREHDGARTGPPPGGESTPARRDTATSPQGSAPTRDRPHPAPANPAPAEAGSTPTPPDTSGVRRW